MFGAATTVLIGLVACHHFRNDGVPITTLKFLTTESLAANMAGRFIPFDRDSFLVHTHTVGFAKHCQSCVVDAVYS
jgi:hypothetical protein